MSGSSSIQITINIEPMPENMSALQHIERTMDKALEPLRYQRTTSSWGKQVKLNYAKIRLTSK